MTIYKEIEIIFLDSLSESNETYSLEAVLSKDTLKNIGEKIKGIFQDLLNWVQEAIYKFSTKLKGILVTNEGYKKILIENMNKYAVQIDQIEVIAYDYDLNYLRSFPKKLNQVSNLLMSYSNNDSDENPLLYTTENFDKWVLSKFDYDGTKYTDFFSHLKEKFRSKKEKRIVKKDELPKYTYACIHYKELIDSVNSDFDKVKNMIKTVRTGLRGKMVPGNNKLPTDEKKDILRKISNLGRLIKFRTSMISFLSALISEYILYSREITKRFYKIHFGI